MIYGIGHADSVFSVATNENGGVISHDRNGFHNRPSCILGEWVMSLDAVATSQKGVAIDCIVYAV